MGWFAAGAAAGALAGTAFGASVGAAAGAAYGGACTRPTGGGTGMDADDESPESPMFTKESQSGDAGR